MEETKLCAYMFVRSVTKRDMEPGVIIVLAKDYEQATRLANSDHLHEYSLTIIDTPNVVYRR